MSRESDQKIIDIFAQMTRVPAHDLDKTITLQDRLGFDDLDLVELALEIENVLAIDIPDEDLVKMSTIGDVQKYVAGKVKP